MLGMTPFEMGELRAEGFCDILQVARGYAAEVVLLCVSLNQSPALACAFPATCGKEQFRVQPQLLWEAI